ncbi:hypothetical protein [Lactobacillus agrestimuris]|uniref:hypothetical protein n=1 Tax=Lactobacillus agrestimuris TaxID=2941328 RepID=UPI00204350D9|nr:hypothetical protein [Lactobacillus agrestimuris]
MNSKLIELHQRSNNPNYLIGYLIRDNLDWVSLLSIDPAGNDGGVRFIKKGDIIEVSQASSALSFISNLLAQKQIPDPQENLSQSSRRLLEQNFSDIFAILQYALKHETLLKLSLRNSAVYGGFITELNEDEVRLFTYNDDKIFEELVETTIKLNDIVEVIFYDLDLKITSEYISYQSSTGQIGNDLDLVQIHFRYLNDQRFKDDTMFGRIITQNNTHLLVERPDDNGQIFALTVVNRAAIAHITSSSDYLNYLNFAYWYNQRQNNLDPYNFQKFAQQFTQIPSFKEIISTSKPGHLLLTDSIELDEVNWGSVLFANDEEFVLRPIINFDLGEPFPIEYQELCSIDLISADTIHLQSYLKSIHRI